MEHKLANLALTLFLNLIHLVRCENIPSCNSTSLEPCPGRNIICDESIKRCICEEGFSWDGQQCSVPNTNEETGIGATVILALLFTLALVLCGLVLVFRKYKLLNYIRQKINARQNHNVMYEDVMIGQDDPPLSP